MKELLLIAVGSAFVNNVVLSQFLGLCPFFGVSKKVNTAAGMGAAVIFVITIASFITSVLDKFILQQFDITYLRTIVFILVLIVYFIFVKNIKKKVNFTKIQKKAKPVKTSLTHKFLRKQRFDFGNPRVNARLSLVFLVVIVKRKPYKLVV